RAHLTHQNGVTIGIGAHRAGRAYGAACTGKVLNDDLLAFAFTTGFCRDRRIATVRSGNTPREDSMKKLIVPAVLASAGVVAAVAWAQAPQQGPGFQARPYFQMPLEKDPSRVVRLQSVVIPAGAGNQFHRHPGDQW